MTVIIEKPAVNLREELADLRNQGTYQEQQFYFGSLVTNGTFDVDANWTKGTGWTISGGVATSATATSGSLVQTISLVAGRRYAVKYEITAYTSGAIIPIFIGGTSVLGSSGSGLGVKTAYITAVTGNNQLSISKNGSADAYSIDNVSVFEVDANDDVIHTMPKGWKPKDVFEDGLLQREGAANDYEVVYDGFDYFVKPAVAPGATTQTCVIGVRA